MPPFRDVLMTCAALFLLGAPLAWAAYLAFFDPHAGVLIAGKQVPAGALVSLLP